MIRLYLFCLSFMKKLWFQLAVTYTILSFFALILIFFILYGVDDYSDYCKIMTVNNVESLIKEENIVFEQAIRDADDSKWWCKVRDIIRGKLMNMELVSSNSVYRITSSSIPEVYIQVADKNARLLMSDPVNFSGKITAQFDALKRIPSLTGSASWMLDDGSIWVDMPITDGDDEIIGRLSILYIAEFNFWVQLQSVISFLLSIWSSVFLLSVPIGITCGLVAARYVTRQLQKMNEVTESWRRGSFDARIALPNDDVLVRHSQYLNDMAQDLELFLSLKQSIAVNDERTRLARELHDTVKQKLFALGLQLATAKVKLGAIDVANEYILEAEFINQEAQRDLMEIITQMRPVDVGSVSIIERIRVISVDFMRRFGVNIELVFSDSVQCSPHTEHHIRRIVQEALMNAVRHGKASRIEITCAVDSNTVTLTIVDNGWGFDVRNTTRGLGIASMRDRMCDLSYGIFDIQSTAGIGTQVKLSWRHIS